MSRMLRLANKSLLSNFGLSKQFNRNQIIPQFNNGYYLAKYGTTASPHLHSNFKKDDIIEGFVVNEVTDVNEFQLRAIRLTHINTAAQYLHLARNDSNNVFSVGFRTTPMDSTGLPHILEHTVLCGSEKYPCRDPFFKMYRRSLATFMNALTGSDYTMYPFSSQNLKDYRNLQSVYLDSVFKPNLREIDFWQEGWRLEHTDVNDKASPIIFKGVVFNEMKGVFNDNKNIFIEAVLNAILPSHTYSVISGGDPLVIPQLKHEDLVNFHSTYYHASNSRFYSYGNFPLEDHLKFVNDEYLCQSNKTDASISKVPPEKRWDKPRRLHVSCRPDPLIADSSRQGVIAISHLWNDITDVQTSYELSILSKLLLSGSHTKLYKSLIESNIGTGFGPLTGFNADSRDTLFSVNLQGVNPDNFKKVEEIYDQTIAAIVEEGFSKDHIDAIMHNIELHTKHQTAKFGLSLLFSVTPVSIHDGDVIQSLKINDAVHILNEKMKKDPKYLQGLLKKYLVDNTHKLVATMTPDVEYDNRNTMAERKLLQTKLNELTSTEIDKIYQQGQILLAEQLKDDDAHVLPTLTIQDIGENAIRYETTDLSIRNVPVQLAIEPTNGIAYYKGILNTKDLNPNLKELMPLFTLVINDMGTKNYTYAKFSEMMQQKTGGLSFSCHIRQCKDDTHTYEEGIMIDSYSLDRYVKDMWDLWTELFNNVKVDDLDRFDTLVKSNAANLVNAIASAGHSYALSTAASFVSPVMQQKEKMSGLYHVGKMKKLAQMKDLGPILTNIQEIAAHVLNKETLRSSINICEDNKTKILNSMETFYDSLSGTPSRTSLHTTVKDENTQEAAIHHVLPYSVNYAAKSILAVPYTDPDHATLRVLSNLLTPIYLHPEIREKGGAYGGAAVVSQEGVFSFYSYRDPNSTRTFDVFDQSYDYLKKYSLSQDRINEAILSTFQSVDAPVPPHMRGLTKFFYDITPDDIQRHREQLKAVTRDKLMEVSEKYLRPGQNIKVGRALLGPSNPDLIQRKTENWTVLEHEEDVTEFAKVDSSH